MDQGVVVLLQEAQTAHGVPNRGLAGEVGSGWEKILEDVVVELIKLGWTGRVIYCKEKFGELRLALGDLDDQMQVIVDEAIKQAARTCESCGQPAKNENDNGWWRVECAECKAHRARVKAVSYKPFRGTADMQYPGHVYTAWQERHNEFRCCPEAPKNQTKEEMIAWSRATQTHHITLEKLEKLVADYEKKQANG